MLAPIGHNNPPPPTAIERAAEPIEALRMWLAINPVILLEDEARDAKVVHDNVVSALKSVEAERKAQVDPLNAEVKAINTKYFRLHNPDSKRGFWDELLGQLKSRMTAYAIQEERKRHEAEEAARQAAAEAAEAARRAAEAEAEARDMAASGVCDVDLAGAIEASREAGQQAVRADWTARRAEGKTRVRISGGVGNAVSLKDKETGLIVTDWKSAIEEMGLTKDIADAIAKSARAYRKLTDALPTGVEAIFERSL
jgi:hypothetical protein